MTARIDTESAAAICACQLQLTGGFGHLLGVEQQVPIGAHCAGPLGGVRVPDGGVIVQRKGQVVVDQVLARHLPRTHTSRASGLTVSLYHLSILDEIWTVIPF